jgi:hypothetical protein
MAEDNEVIIDENVNTAPIVETEEVIKDVVEDVVKNDDFDVSAFADAPIVREEVKAEEDGEGEGEEENGDVVNWASYEEDGDDGGKGGEGEQAELENAKPTAASTESFKAVADELGLKFETIEELKEHLIKVEDENNKLRTSSGSSATNDAITKLTNLKNKDSEELVRLSLEKQGFTGEELEDAVDKYIDNGMIDIEAKKIRNTIDNAIVNEQNKLTQSTVDADAMQQKEHEESVKKLGEHLSQTKTMFGLAMAKDEESLGKVQQGHLKYITSGKFMEDVFKDDASLSEAAWFVKNKDIIIRAISNENLQKGKQAILDDISEPEVINTQRFKDPSGTNEFDPKKFTFGQVKEKK